MTRSAVETDIAQESDINADAYIHKPLDPAEFIDIIRQMTEFGIPIASGELLD